MIFALEMIGMVVALVVIHEFGHFATAKFFNVKVHEFGIGFPPKLFGFRKGETEYTLNLIPLGGFVKLEGENDPAEPRSLARKSPAVRAIVLSAGSFMNAVLAIAIFTGLFMVPRDVTVGDVLIQDVNANSPAEAAGIRPGDRVISADGHEVENINDLASRITRNLGSEITMTLERGGQVREVSLEPRWRPPEGEGAAGILLRLDNATVESRSYPFWEAVPKAVGQIGDVLSLTWRAISQWIFGDAPAPFSGPVGIVSGSKEVVDVGGAVALFPLAALLSVSLSIFNILPIPALDGGRLLFVIIEWVRGGKRIPPEKEGLVHMIGFALLIAMVLVVSYNDIARLIRGDSFLR